MPVLAPVTTATRPFIFCLFILLSPPKKCGAGFQPAHGRRQGQVGNLPHTFSLFQGVVSNDMNDSSVNQPRRNQGPEDRSECVFVSFVSSWLILIVSPVVAHCGMNDSLKY